MVADFMVADSAVGAAFAARVVIAAADSMAGAALSAALVQVDIATGSDGRAEGRRADSLEAEAGDREAGPDRRLVGAEDRGWEQPTPH
jgi:hypothetical protein